MKMMTSPLKIMDGEGEVMSKTERYPGRDRIATEPGGCECEQCGCIFIGEEWHSRCAVCQDAMLSERAKRMEES